MVASLVQRESKPQDFAKVARVIYNRLIAPDHRRLEFDSTVNYSLDRQEVATTDADRGQGHTVEHLCPRRSSGDADLLTGPARARRGGEPRTGGLAVLRHRRPAGHHAVHPRLPAAPGQHRARPTQRCARQRTMSRRDASAGRAVLGSPIAHSRSPQLHLAAYRALGLADWTYERIECTADELPSLVGGFGPEWVGLSVTMPGKFAALQFADERTARAELVGSANTLVRTASGWRADNTDVDGVTGALGRPSSRRAAPRCSARVARRPPPSPGSPSSACRTCRSSPATATRPPR